MTFLPGQFVPDLFSPSGTNFSYSVNNNSKYKKSSTLKNQMRTTTEATTTTTTIPGTQSKSAGLTPVLYNSPGMYQDSLGGCGLGIRCCYIPTLLRGCTINISRVTVNNNKCKKAKKYQNSLGAGGPGTRCCYKATRWGGCTINISSVNCEQQVRKIVT